MSTDWVFRSDVASSKGTTASSEDKLKPAKKKKITSLSEYFGSDPVKQKESFSKPQKVLVTMVISW